MKNCTTLAVCRIVIFVIIFIFTSVLSADTFIVTSTSENGAGSLREAINNSDSHTGADTIIFNIPATDAGYDPLKGVWTIQVQTRLPAINDDSTFIDGSSQAIFIGEDSNPFGPEIVINGLHAGSFEGLGINSNYNIVGSLTINGFSAGGIGIYGDNNKVYGCFIGPDYSGGGRVSGQGYGIFISMGAADNIIGGTEEGERNIISGNKYSGLVIRGSAHDNHVSGNYIGITSTGTDTLGNLNYGIELSFEARENIIGPGNVISGNYNHGIEIVEVGTDSNYVIGNYIGTNAAGTSFLPNKANGVMIDLNAQYNFIGGLAEEQRNVISGNGFEGVQIYGEGTSYNVVAGNYIGLSAAGDSLGNNINGVSIIYYASHNVIGPGNVISSNKSNGIALSYNYPSRNIIKGNLVGTDPLGIESRGNKYSGISISSGKGNIIGGTLTEDRNVISGNEGSGIRIYSSSNQSDSTEVIGNYIGTDISGTGNLDNKYYGISITGTLQNITCSLNVVSGNELSGLYMSGSISNSIISNNKIGVDVTGTGELGNKQYGIQLFSDCSNNEIGPGNVVAYNKYNGIYIYGNSIQNRITENSIFSNGWKGIDNSDGGNNELTSPVITEFGSVIGTAPSNSVVEIFSGVDKQGGQNFKGSVQADDIGHFIWEGTVAGPWITATATDADGNTSEFSAAKLYGNIVVTTTADTGEGSLRNAIELANSSAGPDTIIFKIPDTDPGFNGTVWVIS
ncbi:right-handed parallel beta-helix repeat-containing protein, partial [bacterium]|nr:right-handed parallel beta-helix repeat-containing protein [bacterium]